MLTLTNLSKSYGDQDLFSSVSCTIGARDRIAIIGPNGSGKTTLFEIIAGNITPDSGSVLMRKDVTIGYAKQEVTPFSREKLIENVIRSSTNVTGLMHRINILQEALAEEDGEEDAEELLRELGELQHTYEAAGGYNTEYQAKIILSGLGFSVADFERPLSEFSGGWLMRISLARLLMLNPDILLLDEPTNHLDLESCIWFEEYLKSYQGAVLVTSHDRAFLNRVAHKIIAIEKEEVIFYHGSYDDFMVARQKDMEMREATARAQEVKFRKEMRFIEKFRYKATKAAQVQSRLKQLQKIDRITVPRTTKKIHFAFPEPARGGDDVITLNHIYKSYDGNTVYRDLNISLSRGDRAALVGANGAGKTTLLKILAGVLPFESGERIPGFNIATAYYAQYQLELLNPENTVLDELRSVSPDDSEQKLRGMLGAFLFAGDDVHKSIAVLSGGEKSRLAIVKMLVKPANFLLMDEPTNHLDISSREILIDALDAYHGTLCFITHDRTVISQIANKIIEIRNGKPAVFSGSYEEYLEAKEASGSEETQSVAATNGKEPSRREQERQRKAAEAELRNSYYRDSQPLKKRLATIEDDLAGFERQFRELEESFATPSFYEDSTEIAGATIKHRELKKLIETLSGEYESLFIEAENKKADFEERLKKI